MVEHIPRNAIKTSFGLYWVRYQCNKHKMICAVPPCPLCMEEL